MRRFDDNTRVFDFGQNFSGWVRIRVKGAAGETVCMKFAENAYEDGQIDSTTTRAAEALDTYTLKGDGEEVYEPAFYLPRISLCSHHGITGGHGGQLH